MTKIVEEVAGCEKVGPSEEYTSIARDGGGNVLTICLLGCTGVGKSSLANAMFRRREQDIFPVGDGCEAATTMTQMRILPWRGNGPLLRCIDSPGLDDTEDRDLEHNEAFAHVLKNQAKHVHAFLLLFKAEDKRMSASVRKMLGIFKRMFGDSFLNNVVIVFTHWSYTNVSCKQRELKNQTEDRVSALFNKALKKEMNYEGNFECVFIDSFINATTDAVLQELYQGECPRIQQRFDEELAKIDSFMRKTQPFFCESVEAVVAKDAFKQRVIANLSLRDHLDPQSLGRRLINAEKDVIHQGKMRWHRQWIWAVLRRRQLLFFKDKSRQEKAGPSTLDLTGCICSARMAIKITTKYYINIYSPLPDESGHVLQLDVCFKEAEERNRWMILIQAATQASDSCHRILRFHAALTEAKTQEEYMHAISIIENETIIIPTEWVQNEGAPRGGHSDTVSFQQASRDIDRDNVALDSHEFAMTGRIYSLPDPYDLTAELAWSIIKAHGSAGDDDEARALLLATDVVRSCSRTNASYFFAAEMLFRNSDLIVSARDTSGTGSS